jgi:hypothetical protein
MDLRWVNDLRLAASFVRSIRTNDVGVNLDLSELAAEIEAIAAQLDPGAGDPVTETERVPRGKV